MFRKNKQARSKSLAAAPPPAKGKSNAAGRSFSCPTFLRGGKKPDGIMKWQTADESLHKKYKENRKKVDSSIHFNVLEIREYARTVGDNPSCSSGPPISISWDYDPHTKILSIDEYEKSRPARRSHIEMVLPRSVRDRMLRKEWDIPQRQIAEAVRNNIKIKNQRRATVNNLNKADKMEELMENAGKKLMRGLLLKKSTAQQVADLERQWEQAEQVRKQAELTHQMKDEYNNNDDDGDVEDVDPTAEDEGSPSEDEKEEEAAAAAVVATKKKGKENRGSGSPTSPKKAAKTTATTLPASVKKRIIQAVEDSDSSEEDRQSEGEATAQAASRHNKHVVDPPFEAVEC